MGSEPFTRDWDMVVRSDLAPHLLPPGPLRCMQRPVDVAMVPDGARQALARDVGRHGLEDMLVVPALVRPGPRWRHCLYSPPCVLGIGGDLAEPPDCLGCPVTGICQGEGRVGSQVRTLRTRSTGNLP